MVKEISTLQRVSVKRGPDTRMRMWMADADGKMRMEKCGWKKMRITKSKKEKTRNADGKKK